MAVSAPVEPVEPVAVSAPVETAPAEALAEEAFSETAVTEGVAGAVLESTVDDAESAEGQVEADARG